MTNEDLMQFKQLLKEELKDFATKDDLKSFATKDDLKREFRNYPTKEDLTKELANFATKDDLQQALVKTEKRIITKVGEFILDRINPQLDQKLDKSEFEKFKKQLRSLS